MYASIFKNLLNPFNSSTSKEEISHHVRFGVLDGWRAVSILTILACHLLPLGPKAWELNEMAAPLGMSLFFTLSGFLISSNLLRNPSVPPFLIRRLARILPLAYLATIIFLTMQIKTLDYYINTFLFTLYYRWQFLTPLTSPLWSLCVEIHFYLIIALLVGLFGKRGIFLLPFLGLAITAWRVYAGVYVSLFTHERGDEILAGVTLALIYADQLGPLGRSIRLGLSRLPLLVFACAFLISCHPLSGPLQYLRPYLGATVVGHTLFATGSKFPILNSRVMRYIAEISYALYVIHPLARYGWFDSGTKLAKYLKRPLTFAVIFALAHISTFSFERHWITLGKKWSRRWASEHKTSTSGGAARVQSTP